MEIDVLLFNRKGQIYHAAGWFPKSAWDACQWPARDSAIILAAFGCSPRALFGFLATSCITRIRNEQMYTTRKPWMHVKTLQLLPFGSHPSLIIPGCFLGRKSAKQLVEVKNPQVLKTKIVNFRSIIQKMIRFNPDVRMIPMPRARRNWSALQNRKHLLFLYWQEKQFWLKIYTQNRSMFCSLADASIFTGSGHRSDDQQSSALF